MANRFKVNSISLQSFCHISRDALITSSINCLTSFLAGFVIFSVMGYMASVQNKDISEVGQEGKNTKIQTEY